MRFAQLGVLVNAMLAIVKLVAGITGNAYVLVADALESTTDIFSSLVVWGGLSIASQPADENHPYGHGRAEPLAAAVVALILMGVALGIAIRAVGELRAPHEGPAAFTLPVLVLVIIVKEVLARRVFAGGHEVGSTAVRNDAHHHRADVITSSAAFLGISIALYGGPGWESADDWAALVASSVIFYNAVKMLSPAVQDLMDHAPADDVAARIAAAALAVAETRAIEKLKVRKAGLSYFVDLHVQADPAISLHEAHIVSGKVKGAIRSAVPAVDYVLIHMEPFEKPNALL